MVLVCKLFSLHKIHHRNQMYRFIKQVTSHREMCCIWTIQTVIWCIWYSFLANRSVTSGCWRSEGWSYCDWTHKFFHDLDLLSRLKRCVQNLHTEDFFVMSVLHRIPPWYLTFSLSLFPPLVSSSVSKCTVASLVYVCHCLSDCMFLLFSPFTTLQCLFSLTTRVLSSVTLACLYLVPTTPPFLSVSVPLSPLRTPLLTRHWPAANCVWFVHILTGNMSTYLLKIHHIAARCSLLFESHTHGCSHAHTLTM